MDGVISQAAGEDQQVHGITPDGRGFGAASRPTHRTGKARLLPTPTSSQRPGHRPTQPDPRAEPPSTLAPTPRAPLAASLRRRLLIPSPGRSRVGCRDPFIGGADVP
jgi:hypothetical protein